MAMGTDKEDTDPSSPTALRISGFGLPSAKAEAATVDFPSSGKPTTDPGLGPRPPSDPPAPLGTGRSHGVIVPPPSDRPPPYNPNAITPPEFKPLARSPRSSSSPNPQKDSVELLLEGMAGPRPERRKTTPQSDGEASASYHAEHGLRPARSSSEPGPKVVVERPVPTAAPSRPRPVITVPGRAQPAGSREALSTFVPGRVLRRRVAMAVMAGILIVLLLFMGLRLSEDRHAAASPPSGPTVAAAPLPVPTPPSPATPVAPSPTASSASVASQPAAPSPVEGPASVEPVGVEPLQPHASSSGSSRHHHAPGDPNTGDLGEFKARF
jgi:hypothetical protein